VCSQPRVNDTSTAKYSVPRCSSDGDEDNVAAGDGGTVATIARRTRLERKQAFAIPLSMIAQLFKRSPSALRARQSRRTSVMEY